MSCALFLTGFRLMLVWVGAGAPRGKGGKEGAEGMADGIAGDVDMAPEGGGATGGAPGRRRGGDMMGEA